MIRKWRLHDCFKNLDLRPISSPERRRRGNYENEIGLQERLPLRLDRIGNHKRPAGSVLLKQWYPLHRANEAEVRALLGRPVTLVNPKDGVYVDEEGSVFQTAEKGETQPIEVERSPVECQKRGSGRAKASPDGAVAPADGVGQDSHRGNVVNREGGKTEGKVVRVVESDDTAEKQARGGRERKRPVQTAGSGRLNLREKFAEVRRRLGYVQKRGHNERHNYSYVMAADLAGAVGDILAELGVVMIPQLQSISTETPRSSSERIARIVMNYRFVDTKSGEELTVRVAGEGADPGDKAPYKAMTGALKYALLQSFLLASGDDPEDERGNSRSALASERVITPEQVCELQRLIEETGTELERVLAYYRISALGEMTEASYRRALELLNRKLAKQNRGESAHAQI